MYKPWTPEIKREAQTTNPFQLLITAHNQWLINHLQSPSGISSRLLLAAMNSVRLDSLPMPGGTPSKSSLFELMYSFFSLDSLQIADWIARHEQMLKAHKEWNRTLQPSERGRPYRQWGELVAAQVERLQLSPLVNAERQLGDLITAQVESL